MSRQAWIAAAFFTAVIVLAIAAEAPTTPESGWPHDPVVFIPSLLMVIFFGGWMIFGAISDRAAKRRKDGDGSGS
jgi:preprotein translocase subunit SecG